MLARLHINLYATLFALSAVDESLLATGRAVYSYQPRGAGISSSTSAELLAADMACGRCPAGWRCGFDLAPPDRRRRDIDNVQKPLLDALQHGGAYRRRLRKSIGC
jgi:hypothetical protein